MNKLVNDNLYETRNNLINEIALLSDEQFNRKPDMKKWSIAQICHHLFLVEEATIKAIAWGLKEADSAHIERKEIHLILLDRTNKIKAQLIVEPDVKPFKVRGIIDLLSYSRKKLKTFLGTIEDKSVLAKKLVKHPALGELPLNQWIEQIYLHEQRHIEQIKEIKSILNSRH